VRPALVVPLDPAPNDLPRLRECLKDVLSHALFFKSQKPLNDPILLWRIRRDEFLLEPIVPTRLA